MILYQWRGSVGNFGDELNALLWPALLPDFFDGDPETRFLGIGSVLDRRHPVAPRKLVAGAGYGGYQPKPHIGDDYIIHWVRGPHTARALGLPASLGLGDPATLIPHVLGRTASRKGSIGFMPHFETMTRGAWSAIAPRFGIQLIDPRDPPLTVLDAIAGCRLLLTEALHGAVIADALRVPWIAIRPFAAIHHAKWHDWAASLDMTIRFRPLAASTPAEWITRIAGHWEAPQRWLDKHPMLPLRRGMADQAANSLLRLATVEPQLSRASRLEQSCDRMLHAVERLRVAPCVGVWQLRRRDRLSRVPQSGLQPHPDSAYQLLSIN